MTADSTLVLVVGLVAGFCLGHLQAWRFARKLEAHRVRLADWDKPFDAQAPAPGRIIHPDFSESAR